MTIGDQATLIAAKGNCDLSSNRAFVPHGLSFCSALAASAHSVRPCNK